MIQASRLGKYKIISQAVAIPELALHYDYFNISFQKVGIIFLQAALLITIWSGNDYFRQFVRFFLSDSN